MAELLKVHIEEHAPTGTNVVLEDAWKRSIPAKPDGEDKIQGMDLTDKFPGLFKGRSIFILDDAEDQRLDEAFWLSLGELIESDTAFRLVSIACTPKDPSPFRSFASKFAPSPIQHIRLASVDNGDNIAIGLALTRLEFTLFVNGILYNDGNNYFDISFLDWAFEVTGGHAGVCKLLLLGMKEESVSPPFSCSCHKLETSIVSLIVC